MYNGASTTFINSSLLVDSQLMKVKDALVNNLKNDVFH